MTHDAIRTRRQELDARNAELSKLVAELTRERRALQELCDHANAKLRTDCFGSPDGQCPDCGKYW